MMITTIATITIAKAIHCAVGPNRRRLAETSPRARVGRPFGAVTALPPAAFEFDVDEAIRPETLLNRLVFRTRDDGARRAIMSAC